MILWIIITAIIGVVVGPGHDCHENCVNTLLFVNATFNRHICDSIKDIQCEHLHLHNELNVQTIYQPVCASDGVEYENHCEFAIQRCAYLFPHHNDPVTDLQILNYGPCSQTTTQTPTQPSTTTAPAQPGVSTTTVANAPMTTHSGIHDLMAGVFCANKDSITCNGGLTIVCGSDGQYYPNACELSKAACLDATLELADDQRLCLP